MVMILFLGATLHVNSTTQPSVLEVIQNKDLHIQVLNQYILAAMVVRVVQILECCLVNEGNVAIPQINVSGQFSNDNCHVRELQYGQAISNVLAWAKQVLKKSHDRHEWRISDQMKAD